MKNYLETSGNFECFRTGGRDNKYTVLTLLNLRTAAIILAAIVGWAASPAPCQDVSATTNSVRFVQISDVHMVGFTREGERICPRLPAIAWWYHSRRYDLMGYLLPRAIKQLDAEFKPDFFIFTGDLLENGADGHGPEDLRQFLEVVRESTDKPAHFVYGNHDGPVKQWETICGPANYSFVTRNVVFAVINSGGCNPKKEVPGAAEAPALLDKVMTEAAGRRLIMFAHLLTVPGDKPGYSMLRAAEVRGRLEQYPQTAAVINGHYHAGKRAETNGIHYFTARAFCQSPFCCYAFELTASRLICTPYKFGGRKKGFVSQPPIFMPLRNAVP